MSLFVSHPGMRAWWAIPANRMRLTEQRRRQVYDIAAVKARLPLANTPEARARAAASRAATIAAANAHQRRMVEDMARAAGVGPGMRDVALMRQWMACGLRLCTLADWMGVHRETVGGWVRYGVRPSR